MLMKETTIPIPNIYQGGMNWMIIVRMKKVNRKRRERLQEGVKLVQLDHYQRQMIPIPMSKGKHLRF